MMMTTFGEGGLSRASGTSLHPMFAGAVHGSALEVVQNGAHEALVKESADAADGKDTFERKPNPGPPAAPSRKTI